MVVSCKFPPKWLPRYIRTALLLGWFLSLYTLYVCLISPRKTPTTLVCAPPDLTLSDDALSSYFPALPPLDCSNSGKNYDWLRVSGTKIHLTKRALADLPQNGTLVCVFLPVLRKNDFTNTMGRPVVIKFTRESPNVTIERYSLIRVGCKNDKGELFDSIIALPNTEPGFQTKTPQKTDQTNIIMLGLDSLSAMSWKRLLPQTLEKFKELGGHFLNGYNIIGDGTVMALLPILTGQTELTLPEARRGYPGATSVDEYPWIWRQLESKGYKTFWQEDMAHIGTFQYRLHGFDHPPTHYYGRPFMLEVYKSLHNWQQYCLRSTARHLAYLDILKNFLSFSPETPKFALSFLSELSHDNNSLAQMQDGDMSEFLQWMAQAGLMENSFILLFSDHGSRFSEFRATRQGHLEERLPLMGIIPPKKLMQMNPGYLDKLISNADALTTPFDIHATLEHVSGESVSTKKGVSAFKSISRLRTCAAVGISPHWCACQWSRKLNSSHWSNDAALAVIRIIDGINEEITMVKALECQKLRLDRIMEIHEIRTSDSADRSTLMVSFQVSPGGGRFEATVQRENPQKPYKINNNRDISRLNSYGNVANCIAEQIPHLRPFCFCK